MMVREARQKSEFELIQSTSECVFLHRSVVGQSHPAVANRFYGAAGGAHNAG